LLCVLKGIASFVIAFSPRKDLRDSLRKTVSVTNTNTKADTEEGKLIVSFSTGQSLLIPLRASIATPFLSASTPRMFFGVCHVSVTNTEGTLLLSNPTNVPARWTVTHVPGAGAVKRISAIRVKGTLYHNNELAFRVCCTVDVA
jgi:hypothetical protein